MGGGLKQNNYLFLLMNSMLMPHASLSFKVRTWFLSMIGVQNPKDEAVDSRKKHDFGDEVLAWRIKLRKER